MPGEHPTLSALKARKQLLVAEADVHRELIGIEFCAVRQSTAALADRALTVGRFASAAAVAASGISAIRRRRDAAPRSWIRSALRWVKLGTTVWYLVKKPARA